MLQLNQKAATDLLVEHVYANPAPVPSGSLTLCGCGCGTGLGVLLPSHTSFIALGDAERRGAVLYSD